MKLLKKHQNESMREMKNSLSQVKTPVDHLTSRIDHVGNKDLSLEDKVEESITHTWMGTSFSRLRKFSYMVLLKCYLHLHYSILLLLLELFDYCLLMMSHISPRFCSYIFLKF